MIIYFQPTGTRSRDRLVDRFHGEWRVSPRAVAAAAITAEVKGLTVTRSGDLTHQRQQQHRRHGDRSWSAGDRLCSRRTVRSATRGDPARRSRLSASAHAVPRVQAGHGWILPAVCRTTGSYRMFVDFNRGDKSYVAAFTVQVNR